MSQLRPPAERRTSRARRQGMQIGTFTAVAAAAAAVLLAGCGVDRQGERVAVDAAQECAERLGVTVSTSSPDSLVAAAAKPLSSGPVIGFAGDAPLILSYPSKDGTKVAVAVVPASADPTGATTFAEAAEPEAKTAWIIVPTAKAGSVRRCLGGRLA
jgi:hypothetical protein